eukprot:CAMPEP_0115002074 /NCGR_PEP_ID=MMETSP0216-20121206/17786_1 /TAXON_ID=223996 /ORGANISM="Protocruzia adherens, Strain Boccale" /LENGTH=149 /DNA_ID=CAMNT_0002367593 /DNA_START=75 /DNA_END=521 /DNA_ORIENTATION=+
MRNGTLSYSCQKLQAAYDGGDVERMKDYIEYLCRSFNQMGLINNLRRHEVEDSLDLSIISNRRLEQELLSETVLDMATDMKGSQISPIKYIGGASANDDSHINVNASKQLGTGPVGILNKSAVNESSASKRGTGISPFNRSKIGLHSMN